MLSEELIAQALADKQITETEADWYLSYNESLNQIADNKFVKVPSTIKTADEFYSWLHSDPK